jgi:hypothetical protein
MPSVREHIAELANGVFSSPSSRCRLLAATLTVTGLMLSPAAAQKTAARNPHEAAPHAHVYLMRGLMNIFSLGMDQLAAKIESQGVAASVYNHAQADEIVDQIATRYRAGDHGPVILIGHSLGADAVMLMAQSLNRRGIPVALAIPFDGTASYAVSKNVACVINMTQREYAYMRAGVGFHGKLSNVDVNGDAGIDHFTIDKSPQLQAYALRSVLQAARSETCRPADGNSTVAKPKEQPTAHAAPPPLRLGIDG